MKNIFISILLLVSTQFTLAQTSKFDINNYKLFLSNHRNMSYQELTGMYDAGKFHKKIPSLASNIRYLDSVEIKYVLTEYEKKLIAQNGFVVSERPFKGLNMRNALLDIWRKDLPVFISTDLISNAFHESYDAILKNMEVACLIPKLQSLLENMHSKMSEIEKKYSFFPEIRNSIFDTDLYLTVARKLLNSNAQPYFSDNIALVNKIISYTNDGTFIQEPLFSSVSRKVDYSQFKPRGHYTDEQYPQLAKYFKAMIWLGRIELYLIPPQEADAVPSKEDIMRQIIDSYLISELLTLSNSQTIYDEIEKTIKTFVGEQDNVTLEQMRAVFEAAKITKCQDLIAEVNVKRFQDSLATKPFAEQRILSQLLYSDPLSPDKIKPASAFLLFGQRFVIDSYITGSVVYDKIENKVTRMLPSTLDILFSLGNSAAAQLLEKEISEYKYSTNLAALRYLIDSYKEDFWENSIYNLWLNSIRSLNPPNDRATLPEFMQTASYWQFKINSQLSSWTELRHDNLLYAKQSYSGMVMCSFPFGFVEPLPEFYIAMKKLAALTKEKFASLNGDLSKQIKYMEGFASLMDTLTSISQKELANKELDETEKKFLRSIIRDDSYGCGTVYNGWYPNRLVYNSPEVASSYGKWIVADYHTAPTDKFGNMVGWVKHAGTASANLCVLVANFKGIGEMAFVGPVGSYYEYTTTNFFRISDEEWKQSYFTKSSKPAWVNSYMADASGGSLGAGIDLVTDIKRDYSGNEIATSYDLCIANYPNPFNPSTIISFNVPTDASNQLADLKIYDINGRLVKKLLSRELPAGNYLTRWDGMNDENNSVASGVYFYMINVGKYSKSGKMNLIR